MRLLTHNSLKCPARDVEQGYPLRIEVEEMDVVETDCNHEFIRHILPTIDWQGLLVASESIQLSGIPPEYSPGAEI